MMKVYQMVQFLDLAAAAKDGLKTVRNKAEQVDLPECAKAIDTVMSELDKAVGLVYGHTVVKKE